MDRRRFLGGTVAAVALPVAGCIGTPGSSDDPPGSDTSDDTDDRDDEPPDEDPPAGNGIWQPLDDLPEPPEERPVVDFETAPLTAAIPRGRRSTGDRFTVTLHPAEGATADSPATVTVAVANRQSFEQTIRPHRLLVLDDPPVFRTQAHDSIYLVPSEDHPLAETTPGYSRDEDGRWRVESVGEDWFPETITAPPESGFVATYYLLGHHDREEPPIEAGRYRLRWRDGGFTVAVWPTDAPGPDERSSFADVSPPAIPNADEMAWHHDATRETGRYLLPSRETVDLPGAVSVDLYNYSRETMGGNPYYWRLYKLVDGEWYPISPWGWNQPFQELPPGSLADERLVLFHGEPIRLQGPRTVGHLGGGRYAYEVDFSAGEGTHATLLDVEAPALEVEPEPDAAVVETGETVVVELPNYADARRPGTLTVDRVDAEPAAADRRLIPEQLPRRPHRAIRNALTQFAAGVDRVEVRTNRGTALGPLGYDEGETTTIAYRGTVYELSGSLEEE